MRAGPGRVLWRRRLVCVALSLRSLANAVTGGAGILPVSGRAGNPSYFVSGAGARKEAGDSTSRFLWNTPTPCSEREHRLPAWPKQAGCLLSRSKDYGREEVLAGTLTPSHKITLNGRARCLRRRPFLLPARPRGRGVPGRDCAERGPFREVCGSGGGGLTPCAPGGRRGEAPT